MEYNKVASRVSVENKGCKVIKQKASYTTEILDQGMTNECMVGSFRRVAASGGRILECVAHAL